ncbi:MAG: type II toxin-antitoxin system VapC family toxin [Janthinobacterium lividum]
MPTLTDAGPMISLIDGSDHSRLICQSVLRRLERPMVTTWPCYTEAMYFLGKSLGFPGQKALWRLRSSGLLILRDTTTEEADQMEVLMDKYRDAPMDLADASLVVAAQALGVSRVLTLDRHFYAYRFAEGRALEVVP